jgi:flagellar biosynthetic protein FlhB
MSDDSEKHFEATPARIAKAKREGNVVRAQELGGNLAFLAAVLTTCVVAPRIGALARAAMVSATAGATPLATAVPIVAWALLPIGAAAAAAVAASVAQSGGFYLAPLQVRTDRLNPTEGVKRMLSRESLAHAVRAFCAFVLAAAAMLPSLRELVALSAHASTLQQIAGTAWRAAERAAFVSAGIGLAFALAEFGVARRAWLRKLRMSFEEFKREIKEHDGDPQARNRRKSLHRNLLRGAISKVKDAAFVIVNPTHVAVALDYRPPEVPVPVVLVRAAGESALRVRELAAQHRIPVIENVPLARALFGTTNAGDAIPHEHYVTVAEIVAALIRTGALA